MCEPCVLTAERLSVHTVLRDVSGCWRGGQFVGVIGPNGAGKSTLLRALAGLVRPTSGRVVYNGRSVTATSARTRARWIAHLPQSLPAAALFTVREYVEMGPFAQRTLSGRLPSAAHQRVMEAISTFGLTELADIPLARLSGGERQRVGIARCFAQASPVLLLDEPISSLDLHHQLDILQRLRQLASEGHLVMAVLHHLELAARYCTDLVLLHQGRVRAMGSPELVIRPSGLRDVFAVNACTFLDPHTGALRISLSDTLGGAGTRGSS